MTSLLHAPISVHSNYEVLSPPDCLGDIPAYEPTPGDFLFELGRDLGLQGLTAYQVEIPGILSTPDRLRLTRGFHAGRDARRISEAYDLGIALGSEGSGICEPPAGLSLDERDAYRKGYAAGLDEFERYEDLAKRAAWNEFLDDVYADEFADSLPLGQVD